MHFVRHADNCGNSRRSALANKHEWCPKRRICLVLRSRGDHGQYRAPQRLYAADLGIGFRFRDRLGGDELDGGA
jgi:hypothetical protein